MKLSQLIAALQYIQKEEGDLEIYRTGFGTNAPFAFNRTCFEVSHIRNPKGRERQSRFDLAEGEKVLRIC